MQSSWFIRAVGGASVLAGLITVDQAIAGDSAPPKHRIQRAELLDTRHRTILNRDYDDSTDLETYETICPEQAMPSEEEVPAPLALPDAEDPSIPVLDLDFLGMDGGEIEFADGTRIRITRRADGVIALEQLHHVDRDDGNLQPVPEDDLRPVAAPTGDFAVRHAALLAQGKSREAAALAVEFLCDEAEEGEICLPAETMGEPHVVKHDVGYRPGPGRPKVLFPAASGATWDTVSGRLITFRFRGASLEDVARFLRLATGLSVEISLDGESTRAVAVHAAVSDMPMNEALELLARSTGFLFVPLPDGIAIRSPRE